MKYLITGHDILFNLAGQTSHRDSMLDPNTDLEINARAQLFMLEACRKYNRDIKIVFASTRQMYGVPQYLPVDERHPIAPVDINGIHKITGEWYHIVYNKVHGIRTTAMRLTNTYGPGMRVKDDRQTFLGVWVRRIIEGLPLLVFGDGKQVRDFNYVDDVVHAFLSVAESEDTDGEIFNLGGDDPINLKDAAELLVKINGGGSYKMVPFPEDRRVIDIGDYYGNYGKINSTLGWQPSVSLKEGLEKTLAYYRKNQKYYWDGNQGE